MVTPEVARGRSARPVMTRTLWLVGTVIALSGLLFGYDQGVISGALRGIEQSFDIGTTMVEIITSWVTLGALLGALTAGALFPSTNWALRAASSSPTWSTRPCRA